MKAISISFMMMLRQMKNDAMLIMLAVCPLLIGLSFRFIIPLSESLLTEYFGTGEVIKPYYALFDIFLIIITPSMFNYACAMVMLEEYDDHITAYLAVTPLGKKGYLFSRLGFTALIAFAVSIIVGFAFHLSRTNIFTLIGVAFAGTLQGVIVALLIVALSKNKVEGMAVGKFTSLLSIAALIPYFVNGKAQFLASVFPSFWIGKAMQTGGFYPLVVSALLALLWAAIMSNKFMKKIAK